MEEQWKTAIYDGIVYDNYQVSDWGRVKSLNYLHTGKERVLKIRKTKCGYLRVTLYKNGKKKWCLVHRLVVETFLENPDNLPCVNHRNEIKTDNRVENLEYCTVAYNNSYGTRLERVSEKKINGKKAKVVLQFSLDGTFIKEFPSTREVERQLGFFQSNVANCCRGEQKTYKGFIWKYKI